MVNEYPLSDGGWLYTYACEHGSFELEADADGDLVAMLEPVGSPRVAWIL